MSNLHESAFTGEDPHIVASLRYVAQTFAELQEQRHFADYNLSGDLAPIDALAQVKSAEKVFYLWPQIREHQITQEYLVALVVRR